MHSLKHRSCYVVWNGKKGNVIFRFEVYSFVFETNFSREKVIPYDEGCFYVRYSGYMSPRLFYKTKSFTAWVRHLNRSRIYNQSSNSVRYNHAILSSWTDTWLYLFILPAFWTNIKTLYRILAMFVVPSLSRSSHQQQGLVLKCFQESYAISS